MATANSFTEKIQVLAARIPQGKVATYGQLARLAGKPGAARAVGNIMKNNHTPETVPCHRVVAANGALTGYAFGGVTKKEKKLRAEGVIFKGGKVDVTVSLWGGK